MSTLSDRLDVDIKEAMKAKNDRTISALRMVRAAMKNKQIEIGHALSDAEVVSILRTLVKQYTDALVDFIAAGRADLVDRQKAEIELLERYLPAALPESEIEKIVQRVVRDLAATSKDSGRVMGAVMKELAGRVDGNIVRTIVEKILKS